MKNKQRLALILSIAAFLFLGLFVVKPQTPSYPAYVSFSADRDGVKGLHTLLSENGFTVRSWQQHWRHLPQTSNQRLMVIQPYALAEEDVYLIETWVANGNELFLFIRQPVDWPLFRFENTGQRNVTGTIQTMLAPEETGWEGEVATAYRLMEDDGLIPLLQDQQGILAGRVQVGSGSISVFLLPEWLRNDTILQRAHFELLWPYLQGDYAVTWFDDYQRGFEERPGMLAVFPNWLLALLLQPLIGVLLWLWYKAVRFGPAYTPREWTVRRGDETLLATAGWYLRQKLTREAFEYQLRYIRSLLRERWGIRTDESERQVLAMIRLRWPKEDADRLADVFESWTLARQSAVYTTKQFVIDSQKADAVIKKLEGE